MANSTAKAVLVVDDDPDMVTLMESILGDSGYRVISAYDGHEGLRAVSVEMPALILLDMTMPGMQGSEFIREFHSIYDHGAPIVLLTGLDEGRQAAEAAGADGFLPKPFDLDRLLETVARYIGDRPVM